ncbi:MAG: thioredoxin domain-containing protein [Proteobacteria bacterium]|nr:thioredoxin domain-containing protein [Pseudomonadota bacterium]
MRILFSFVLLLGLIPTLCMAQTPTCDTLKGETKAVAQEVMSKAYLYDCCDETITKCLAKTPTCSLATRLANEVCRLAKDGKSAQDITRTLEQRASTMTDINPSVDIALKPENIWGNPEAKVILSIYLCGRCPYCSRHVPAMLRAIESAGLKDKLAVNLRLFPIKTHDHSTEAALAIEAAAKMGQAWPYIIKLYENFDAFSLNSISKYASELNMDATQFSTLLKDKATRAAVVDSKKEGLKNTVASTPTFFINGHKVEGIFDVDSMISMLEEAIEKNP